MERILRNRLSAGSRGAQAAGTTTPAPTSGASAATATAVGRPNRANRRAVRARRAPRRELMGRTGAPSSRTGWVRRHRGPHGEPRASRGADRGYRFRSSSASALAGGVVNTSSRCRRRPTPTTSRSPAGPPSRAALRNVRVTAGRQQVANVSAAPRAAAERGNHTSAGHHLAAARPWLPSGPVHGGCGAHWTLAALRDRGSSAQQLSAAGRFAALLSVDAVPFDGRAPVHLLPHPLDLADGPVFLA